MLYIYIILYIFYTIYILYYTYSKIYIYNLWYVYVYIRMLKTSSHCHIRGLARWPNACGKISLKRLPRCPMGSQGFGAWCAFIMTFIMIIHETWELKEQKWRFFTCKDRERCDGKHQELDQHGKFISKSGITLGGLVTLNCDAWKRGSPRHHSCEKYTTRSSLTWMMWRYHDLRNLHINYWFASVGVWPSSRVDLNRTVAGHALLLKSLDL